MDEAFESLTLRDITDRVHRMSLGSAAASTSREVSFDSGSEGVRLSSAGARRLPRSSTLRSSARSTPDFVNSYVRPPSPDPYYTNRAAQHIQQLAASASVSNLARRSSNHASATRRSGPLLPPHLSSLDIPKRYGGNAVFDLYSLTYVGEADVNLLCPICHDPLVDPVTTPCDHTFCYRCIRRSIASSPSGTMCPIDREPLVWGQCFSAARLIRTQLNSLMVKCPYSARGCHLELRREAAEQHAKNECRFRLYKCPGASCSKKIRYKPTDDKCRHEQDNCMYCYAVIEDADREFHLLSCPGSKTRCQTCWQLVCRDSIDIHHEHECEGVEVSCGFADVGCPVRVVRGGLELHYLSCAFHPDTPTGAIIRTQRDLIQSYGEIGSQLREIFARQDEANGRLNEIVAAMASRMDSGRRGGGGGGGMEGALGEGATGDPNRSMSDVDAGFEEVHQNLTQLEARQSMWTLNQVMPIREEVADVRNNLNMMRMHINWLLSRSRDEEHLRTSGANAVPPGSGPGTAAAAGGSSSTIVRPAGFHIGRMPMTPRRRSTSMEFDIARL